MAQHAQRAKDLGIELHSEAGSDIGDVPGEPRDIRSLLSNLIGNAIDACALDPGEDNRRHRVQVRLSREPAHVVIEVQDNGAGMDDETRSKLFSRFFSTKGASGTGLGLMVSHKVVIEHGGSISVASEPGKGSTFTAKLPIERT
jgi:signal transduction histidine kinase